jgi:hypothetical protein
VTCVVAELLQYHKCRLPWRNISYLTLYTEVVTMCTAYFRLKNIEFRLRHLYVMLVLFYAQTPSSLNVAGPLKLSDKYSMHFAHMHTRARARTHTHTHTHTHTVSVYVMNCTCSV